MHNSHCHTCGIRGNKYSSWKFLFFVLKNERRNTSNSSWTCWMDRKSLLAAGFWAPIILSEQQTRFKIAQVYVAENTVELISIFLRNLSFSQQGTMNQASLKKLKPKRNWKWIEGTNFQNCSISGQQKCHITTTSVFNCTPRTSSTTC